MIQWKQHLAYDTVEAAYSPVWPGSHDPQLARTKSILILQFLDLMIQRFVGIMKSVSEHTIAGEIAHRGVC